MLVEKNTKNLKFNESYPTSESVKFGSKNFVVADEGFDSLNSH